MQVTLILFKRLISGKVALFGQVHLSNRRRRACRTPMQPPRPRGLRALAALPAPNVIGTCGAQTHE